MGVWWTARPRPRPRPRPVPSLTDTYARRGASDRADLTRSKREATPAPPSRPHPSAWPPAATYTSLVRARGRLAEARRPSAAGPLSLPCFACSIARARMACMAAWACRRAQKRSMHGSRGNHAPLDSSPCLLVSVRARRSRRGQPRNTSSLARVTLRLLLCLCCLPCSTDCRRPCMATFDLSTSCKQRTK